MMSPHEDTPVNNQLILYRLDEMRAQNKAVLDKMDSFLAAFNEHKRDDAILGAEVLRLAESSKNRPGMWVSVVSAGAAIATVIVSIFSEKHP